MRERERQCASRGGAERVREQGRGRESVRAGEGQRETEGDIESEAGSGL